MPKASSTNLSNGQIYDLYAPPVFGNILKTIPVLEVAEFVLTDTFQRALTNRQAMESSLLSPLTLLLNDARKQSERTLLALRLLHESCGGTTRVV